MFYTRLFKEVRTLWCLLALWDYCCWESLTKSPCGASFMPYLGLRKDNVPAQNGISYKSVYFFFFFFISNRSCDIEFLNFFSNLPAFVNQKRATCNSEQTIFIWRLTFGTPVLFSLCEWTHVASLSSPETQSLMFASVDLGCSSSGGWLPVLLGCTQDPPDKSATIANISSKTAETLPGCFLVMQQQIVAET